MTEHITLAATQLLVIVNKACQSFLILPNYLMSVRTQVLLLFNLPIYLELSQVSPGPNGKTSCDAGSRFFYRPEALHVAQPTATRH